MGDIEFDQMLGILFDYGSVTDEVRVGKNNGKPILLEMLRTDESILGTMIALDTNSV